MFMNRKIFCLIMLASSLMSCEQKETDMDESVKMKTSLEINLISEKTKASGLGGNEENAVSDYQVLVYDMSSRMLESYVKPDPTSISVNIQCTTGPKEVVVLANAPDVSGIVSFDTFLKTKSRLADNASGSLVMEGHAASDLTAAGGAVNVNIRRIVSKVVLDAVNVNFEADAYDHMDFILKRVYLTNIAGDKSYLSETADPSSWYNQIIRTQSPEIDALVYDDISDVNLKESKTYTVKHHFYCYPNPHEDDTFASDHWSPRPTRLVLEAVLGGVPYYYPVSLPPLKQNTRYHVTLNIIRPGATSPEQDMEKYAATFMINVEEWKDSPNVIETI